MLSESSAGSIRDELEIDKYCARIFFSLDDPNSKHFTCISYRLGNIAVDFHFHESVAFELFHPSLQHLVRDRNISTDWTLHILDALDEEPPTPKVAGRGNMHRGVAEYETSDRYCLQYIEQLNAFLILDYKKKQGVWWSRNISEIAEHEKIFPVRHIIRAMFHPMGGLILHGAVVGRNGAGVLIAGKSGAGKSTTSLACLVSGMDFIGDDHCLYHDGIAFSLSQYVKLNSKSLNLIPPLQVVDLHAGETEDKKLILSLFPFFKAQLVNSLQIKAILLPSLSEASHSSLIPSSPSEALKAVAPSSFSQVFKNHSKEMNIMATLVRKFPTYILNITPDTDSVVRLIDETLTK